MGYDADVRWVYLFALGVAAVLIGCHSAQRSQTCAPIGVTTRVIVHGSLHGTPASDRIITDPKRIGQLVAFANARRDCSQPWDTMPAPRVSATFYDNADFLGSIGAGPNFFFVSCSNWRAIRSASDSEIGDFKQLIDTVN
jgi:hypothetical protein